MMEGSPFPIYLAPGVTKVFKSTVEGLDLERSYPAGEPSFLFIFYLFIVFKFDFFSF